MTFETLRKRWSALHPVDKIGSLLTLIGSVLLLLNWKSVLDTIFVWLLNIIVGGAIILITIAVIAGMGWAIGYMARRW